MAARIGLWPMVGLLIANVAMAQVNTMQGGQGYPAGQPQAQVAPPQMGQQPAGPVQYPATQPYVQPQPGQLQGPMQAQGPTQPQGPVQGPAGPPQPRQPQPPFVLTVHQQAEVERVLRAWEQSSSQVKTFECAFTRWIYNDALGNAAQPIIHQGVMKYAAPDRGLFQVDGDRPEKWICDGKSIYEYKYERKQVVEYKLPPEQQGKAIANGPLPFMFGAQAEKLNQRYYLRIIKADGKQIFLEAFPRYQSDAANFRNVMLILDVMGNGTLQPSAVQIFEPSGQSRTVYAFQNPLINFKNPLQIFQGNPFQASLPLGWQRVIDEPAARQARPAGAPPQTSVR